MHTLERVRVSTRRVGAVHVSHELYSMRMGETIRGGILFFWALWLGMFQRFTQDPTGSGTFEAFAQLSGEEWLWAALFTTIAGGCIVVAWGRSLHARVMFNYAQALSWGWIAGAFAVANYKSTAVPVAAGLMIYAAVSTARLANLRGAQTEAS